MKSGFPSPRRWAAFGGTVAVLAGIGLAVWPQPVARTSGPRADVRPAGAASVPLATPGRSYSGAHGSSPAWALSTGGKLPAIPGRPGAGATSAQMGSASASGLPFSAADVLGAGVDLGDAAQRAAIATQWRASERRDKQVAWQRAARLGIPTRSERRDGAVIELMGFRGDEPVYFMTHNANAAISSGASLVQAAPYSLSGSDVTVGVWDGGGVRTSHQELSGRVTILDGASLLDHSTHVGGTIAAAGVVPGAKGMAPAAHVDSYEWNSDKSEMTARGASYPGEPGTLPLSNHSYGEITGWYYTGSTPEWIWYGSGTTSSGTEGDFGKYETNCRDTDALAASLPYFLMFRSAGNDRLDNPATGDTVALSATAATTTSYDASLHPPGDGTYRGGYDTISFDAGAKNVITVGAVNDAVVAGARSAAAATMTSFSSWGPTDDGRIKPDIVANGAELYSSLSGSDSAYGTYSGTSMASPSAAGSAALLVSCFQKLFPGQALRASTLKGLLVHTADDLGAAGPDYIYGWGLLNVRAAVDVISAYAADPGARALVEDRLTSAAATRSYTFAWDGVSPIRATLCWTDPAGSATTSGDSRTARLVNDLDLTIIDPAGATHQAYVMPYVGSWSTAQFSAAAVTGRNSVDNVEQVYLSAPPAPGSYTVVVNCAGTVTTGTQAFSLVLSGAAEATSAAPSMSGISPESGSSGTAVLTIAGANFALGATVALTRDGQADVPATGVEVAGDAIKCRVALDGMAAGVWNVVVTNPDGQRAALSDAFTVAAALWSEDFEAGAADWTHSASVGTTTNWALGTGSSHSTSHSMGAAVPAARNVDDLYAPAIRIPAGATSLRLSFWHSYAFASSRTGGVLEFSIDDGATWFDVASTSSGASLATGGYTGTLSSSGSSQTRNPLAGRSGWTGNNAGFTQVVIDLSDSAKYDGKTLRMCWRLATGQVSGNSSQWYVDDVVLAGAVPTVNLAPNISVAAVAKPDVVTGSTTQLQVMASDDGGEEGLVYTWTASGDYGASVQFSENGTHAASATTATFAKAGSYIITATVRDAEALSASSSTPVSVVQTGSLVVLAPASATLSKGASQSFAAEQFDQFGMSMVPQPVFTWSTDGGTMDAAGLFTAGASTGNFTVTAMANAVSASADVTVTGQSLEAWRAEHFSAGEAGGDAQDFDGDGLANLAEYALGRDPRVPDGTLTPVLDDGHLTLRFTRPRALPDVSYSAEVSGDLMTWQAVSLEVVTDGEEQEIRVRDADGTPEARCRFLRLRLSPVGE